VIVCPRCGVPSEVRLEDFRAAIREQLERLINRLKQFRRVATRYEKLADQYLGMVTLAAILLWLG
jgi:transposase